MSTKYTTDDDSTELGWVQTGRTLFRYGWYVGKKVAIAGVAISVAPLAIPLVILFSAFGLALSVPFGIFYVGMMGVERLMQSLLQLDQGREVRQGDQEEGDDIVGGEKGYLDEREFKYEETLERERDDEYDDVLDEIVEERVYVGTRDPKSEENGERGEDDDDDAIVEIPGEVDTVTEEHGERNNNDVVVESLDEKAGEKDEVVEILNERVSGVEETGGMEKADVDVIVEISVETDAASKEHGEMNTNGRVESLNVSKKGFKPEKENGGMKKDGAKGDADNNEIAVEGITDGNNGTVDKGMERGPEEVQFETGNTDMVEEKEVLIDGTDSKVSKKGDNELSAVSSESDDLSEVKGKSNLADAETRSSAEHAGEVKNVNALASASVESTVTPDVEEFYTKKQLWDQLRALRTIVGYKVAIAKTLPDEMRALYVFTGVELPSTATDASNLLDLNYKLQFLKSVIGVK